jgi:hypothetical protein
MFFTGPAGLGRSTTMRVAEQFCYELCVAIGVMWCKRMFLFTAYTGSAASLIGGKTISKAAYNNQQKQVRTDDITDGIILVVWVYFCTLSCRIHV